MQNKKIQHLADLLIFAMLGVIMFISKYLTEAIPNVHFLGMLTMTYTIVYRKKALIPVYVFVMLMGIFNGFAMWWIPYLYIWTILWGITMLLPKNMNKKSCCSRLCSSLCIARTLLRHTLCPCTGDYVRIEL